MTVETVRLEKLCSIRSGGTPRRSRSEFYGGAVPWARIQDLDAPDGIVRSTEETLTEAGLEAIGGRIFPEGTLLLAMYGSVGKLATAGRALSTNQAILGIQVEDESKLSPRYLARWLRRIQPELIRGARGVAQKNISATLVRDLRIPLPPLPEQRRIAAILDKADAACRKRQVTLDLADQFLRSAFLDMFGDPVTNPKGWPTLRLGMLIEEGPTNGLYRPSSDYGSGTPIVRIDSYFGGDVVSLAGLRRVRLDEADVAKYGLCEDDVLVNRVNAPSHLGKSAIVPELPEPIVFESNMMRLRVARSSIDPFFLVTLLNGQALKRQILRRARDAVNQSSINQDDVRSLMVLVPPLALQTAFRALSAETDLVRARSLRAGATMAGLSAGLSRGAFAGSWPCERS